MRWGCWVWDEHMRWPEIRAEAKSAYEQFFHGVEERGPGLAVTAQAKKEYAAL